MLGIGIDIIELSRMHDILERSGELFLQRTFCETEIARGKRADSPCHFYASAFAAKEAVFKALVLNWQQNVDFREIEVDRGRFGEPIVRLHGNTKAVADAKGCQRVFLSLSYERNLAVAMAFAEAAKPQQVYVQD